MIGLCIGLFCGMPAYGYYQPPVYYAPPPVVYAQPVYVQPGYAYAYSGSYAYAGQRPYRPRCHRNYC